MVRGMKLFLYFLAFLLCLGAKLSNADSGKSVESKRKFISISNKAKDDAVIQCKSDKQNFKKTLKPGEKIRWGLVGETAPTTICQVDVGNGRKGVHGYLCAFVEKECKRECKWRVLDDGVLKLKAAGGEWKSFELKADEEAARNYDEHHSCDDDDDDDYDDDDYDVGKGKRGSGESRSLEPAVAPAPEMKSGTRGARVAPSPNERKGVQRNSPQSMPTPMSEKKKSRKRGARLAPGKSAMSKKKKSRARGAPPPAMQIRKAPAPGKWISEKAKMKGKSRPRNSQSPAPIAFAPSSITKKAQAPKKHGGRKLKPRHPRSTSVPAKSMAPHTTKKVKKAQAPKNHGRRKLKPRHPTPRSPAPTKTPSPKRSSWKKKPRAPVAPPPMNGIPRPSNYYSPSLAPTKSTKKAAPPMKQGRRKLKPRHPRLPVPVKAPTPENKKKKSVASISKSTLPPTEQVKQVPENAKTYTQEKSRPRNSPAPAPATVSRAAPPTKQIKKAQPPKKQGRRKLKPRHPRSMQASAPAPTPENKKTESVAPIAIMKPSENAKTASTPTTKPDHGNIRHGNFPKWKAPAPADWSAPPPTKQSPPPENGKQTSQAPGAKLAPKLKSPPPTEGGEESEGPDAQLSPLPRPGSTFYTCIKEDSS